MDCPGGPFLLQILAGLDLGWIVISQNRSHSLVSLGSATATSMALGPRIRPQEPRGLPGCLHPGAQIVFFRPFNVEFILDFQGQLFLE